MSDNQTKELTFGDIFSMIFRHKKILIITTLIITILGTLFFNLFLNSGTNYSTIFAVEYPNHQSQTLPDGTKFKYTDIISKNSLHAVKDNTPGLEDLEIDKMIESNAISIEFETKTINNQTETRYKINVRSSFFKDKNQAKLFITELTNFPIKNIKSMISNKNHTLSLETYNITSDYELKLNFLNAQKTYLLNGYSQGATLFGELLIVNSTMNNFRQIISNYFTVNSIDALINELSINGYAEKDEALAKEYGMKISQLAEEKAVNIAAINNLKQELKEFQNEYPSLGSETLFDEIYKHIASLVTRNAKIDQEIATLTNKKSYAEGNVPEAEAQAFLTFKEKVNTYYSELVKFTEEYEQNIEFAYEKTSRISFTNPSIITLENGFGIFYSAGLGLIFGLIIASIVCIVYDSEQRRKLALGIEDKKTKAKKVKEEKAEEQTEATIEKEEAKKE